MKTTIGGKEYDNPATIIQGRDLKQMRLKAKVTTSVAAEYMGVKSRKTIENWESGASSPGINKFLLLCRYYDLNSSAIVAQCLERIKAGDPKENYYELNLDLCEMK